MSSDRQQHLSRIYQSVLRVYGSGNGIHAITSKIPHPSVKLIPFQKALNGYTLSWSLLPYFVVTKYTSRHFSSIRQSLLLTSPSLSAMLYLSASPFSLRTAVVFVYPARTEDLLHTFSCNSFSIAYISWFSSFSRILDCSLSEYRVDSENSKLTRCFSICSDSSCQSSLFLISFPCGLRHSSRFHLSIFPSFMVVTRN